MASKTDGKQWQEPSSADVKSGYGKWKRPLTPYDRFMEEQGIPIFRDIGVRRVQDLPLKPWKRMGGNATFIQLYGTEGLWGMYVVEVPSAGALNVEKHLYEEVYLVVEGRGSTEVWREGESERNTFDWQNGSLFTIPSNAITRTVNAPPSPPPLHAGCPPPPGARLLCLAPEPKWPCPRQTATSGK